MAFTPGRTLMCNVCETRLTASLDPAFAQVQLLNTGPGLVFVTFGVGPSVEDDELGVPVPVNQLVTLTKGVGADTLEARVDARYSDGGENWALLFVTVGSGG